MKARILGVPAAAVVVLAMSFAPASAVAAHSTPIVITSGDSANYATRMPGLNSASDLVYTQTDVIPGAYRQQSSLAVQTAAGGPPTVLTPPASIPDDFEGVEPIATVQSEVVAGEGPSAGEGPWIFWDLNSGSEGDISAPGGNTQLVGAAPGGFLAKDGATGDLLTYSETDQSTDLGQPFPGGTDYGAVDGDNGVVAIAYDGNAVFQPWGSPGQFTTLDTGATSLSNFYCDSVDTESAACAAYDPSNNDELVIIRVPLDGSAPVITHTGQDAFDCGSDGLAVTATATVWSCSGTLYSVPAAGGPMSSESLNGGELDGSALGGALIETTQGGFETTPDALTAPTAVVAPAYAPTVASEAALTSHKLVYQDDAPGREQIYKRQISGGKTDPTLGAEGTVDLPQTDAPRFFYVTNQLILRFGPYYSLTVLYHGTQTEIPYPYKGYVVSASVAGVRVALTFPDQKFGPLYTIVYDAATGKQIAVAHSVASAICGTHLVSVDSHGVVQWMSLTGGSTVTIAKTHLRVTNQNGESQAYCSGDEVGWSVARTVKGKVVSVRGVEQVKTHKTTKIDGVLESLTPAGLLTLKSPNLSSSEWLLTSYDGKHTTSLLPGTDTIGPQGITKSDVAFVNADHQVELERLPPAVTHGEG